MYQRTFLLLAFTFLLATGCTTKPISVYPVNSDTQSEIKQILEKEEKAGGLFFSLPQTALLVESTVEVKTQSTGKYYNALALYDSLNKISKMYTHFSQHRFTYEAAVGKEFANSIDQKNKTVGERLSKMDIADFVAPDSALRKRYKNSFIKFMKERKQDYVDSNETAYKIKSGSIELTSDPDPDKLYFAMIPEGKLESKGIKLTLNEHGTVSEATASSTNNTLDYTFAGIKAVAQIAGAVAKEAPTPSKEEKKEEEARRNVQVFLNEYTSIMSYGNKVVTDIDLMKADSKKLESLEKKLNDLLADGGIRTTELYEAIIKPLNEQIKTVNSRFTGTSKTIEKKVKARIVPKIAQNTEMASTTSKATPESEPDNSYEYELFRFTDNGLFQFSEHMMSKACEIEDLGHKKYFSFKITISLDTPPFQTDASTTMATINDIYTATSPPTPHGMPFNVPRPAKIQAVVQYMDGKDMIKETVLQADVFQLAQFGSVGHLPHTIDGKSNQYTLSYFPETGAIKIMDINSTGYDSSSVQAAGDAISALLLIEKTRLENEALKATAKKTIEENE